MMAKKIANFRPYKPKPSLSRVAEEGSAEHPIDLGRDIPTSKRRREEALKGDSDGGDDEDGDGDDEGGSAVTKWVGKRRRSWTMMSSSLS